MVRRAETPGGSLTSSTVEPPDGFQISCTERMTVPDAGYFRFILIQMIATTTAISTSNTTTRMKGSALLLLK
jgi:hypothetical protein